MSALVATDSGHYAECALSWVCGIVERGALGRVTIAEYPSLAALWDDVSQKRVMASKLDAVGFCPGVTQPGPRDAKHAQPWPFLVLDVEGKCEGSGEAKHLTGKPAPSVTETAGRIRAQGWQACIYTTFEHGHAYGPRYRVLIALDSPVPPGEIRRAVEAVAAALRLSEFVDFTCTDPARFFFVASCPKDRADLFERVMIEGSPAILAELIAAPKIAPPPTPQSPPPTPGRADESVIDAFNQAHDIGAILERHGYRPTAKDRWIAPQSSSGEPGVHLLDSGRIFSHHDSDPLNDPKGHDAFSAWCVLEHGGNMKQAVRAAARLLGMSYTPEQRAQKDFAAADVAASEQEPLDPFIERPVPPFPLAVLPDLMRDYAEGCSRASGFDVGAYGFSLIVAASGLIDHRCKLKAGPISVPPHLWGSLSAVSGGGKSPVISAVKFAHEAIHKKMLSESLQRYEMWAAPPPKEREGPPPDIRQLLIQDTTAEGAAKVLKQNPRGVVAFFDELSEWLGRMDAYSGKGADKDRGVWIRAYDGGGQTINRATNLTPMDVQNFSVAMLAGVQPEKLAQMFQKSGAAASDGLFQRFLTYRMQPAVEVDYFAQQGHFDLVNVDNVFKRMFDIWESNKPFQFALSEDALQLAQQHHNTLRTLAQRTPPGRFSEHIDKFPGLTLRLALVLHCLHSAAAGVAPLPTVPTIRFEQAQAIIQCLYRHAEASYSEIDRTGVGQAVTLAKCACEAILTKRWMQFNRGDLTRDATGWQGADPRMAEAGLDLLIEWGWIVDITPTEPGKRGRPSSGRFAVIQTVHEQFAPHAERIRRDRQERHRAVQILAKGRELVE